MTKEAYFEMCEQLGQEPVEDEIPIDSSDFPDLVYTIIIVYSKLKDNWDGMSGRYMGKDYTIVFQLFDLYDIQSQEERLLAMDFLYTIDSTRIKLVSDKITSKTNSKAPR